MVAMSAVSKALYMPLSDRQQCRGRPARRHGLLTGLAADASPSDQEPPDPKDLNRSGREAITAAALQGLVFGLVRAAVDRARRHGYRAVTHESPE